MDAIASDLALDRQAGGCRCGRTIDRKRLGGAALLIIDVEVRGVEKALQLADDLLLIGVPCPVIETELDPAGDSRSEKQNGRKVRDLVPLHHDRSAVGTSAGISESGDELVLPVHLHLVLTG